MTTYSYNGKPCKLIVRYPLGDELWPMVTIEIDGKQINVHQKYVKDHYEPDKRVYRGRDGEPVTADEKMQQLMAFGSAMEKLAIENYTQVRNILPLLTEMKNTMRAYRWAMSKLGCRCMWDDTDERINSDGHCPVHGSYGDPDGWFPETYQALQARIAKVKGIVAACNIQEYEAWGYLIDSALNALEQRQPNAEAQRAPETRYDYDEVTRQFAARGIWGSRLLAPKELVGLANADRQQVEALQATVAELETKAGLADEARELILVNGIADDDNPSSDGRDRLARYDAAITRDVGEQPNAEAEYDNGETQKWATRLAEEMSKCRALQQQIEALQAERDFLERQHDLVKDDSMKACTEAQEWQEASERWRHSAMEQEEQVEALQAKLANLVPKEWTLADWEQELPRLQARVAKLIEVLDDFARGPHRRQFPHVLPTKREEMADALIAGAALGNELQELRLKLSRDAGGR